MEQMIRALELLRGEYRFRGYIHAKAIPGADAALVHRLGLLADRLSVNIELPSERSLAALAPDKTKRTILAPMAQVRDGVAAGRELVKYKGAPRFAPAGQSTQMIVGASPERDVDILRLTQGLYRKYQLKRVFFSAYIPVAENALLPALGTKPPLLREHRLYQADWLLRFYGFDAAEILDDAHPNLDPYLDPKCNWALNHLELFPVDVNRCEYEMLLRVPGIGVKSALRIRLARRTARLRLEDLKKLGVVLKRAQFLSPVRGYFRRCASKPHAHAPAPCWRRTYLPAAHSSLACSTRPACRRALGAGEKPALARAAVRQEALNVGETPVRYVYDGSFEGLLCCVYESVYSVTGSGVRSRCPAQPVWRSGCAHPAGKGRARVCLYCAENRPGRRGTGARHLFPCARLGRRFWCCACTSAIERGKTRPMLSHPAVAPLVAAQKFLRNEARLTLEFLRFEDTGEALVAVIEPQNFVLPYIAHHFCTRFACEKLLIWDKTHAAALVWQNGTARIVPLEGLALPPESAQEAQFKALWKQFYNTIAIAARENPVCRRTRCRNATGPT